MIVRLWLSVLMAELLTAPSAVDASIHLLQHGTLSGKPSQLEQTMDMIPHNQECNRTVTKAKTKFYILVHQVTEDQDLSVTVTPANITIFWELSFLPPLKNGSFQKLGTDMPPGHTLISYTGVSIPLTYDHGRAYSGLYVMTVQAEDDGSLQDINLIFIYVSLKQRSPVEQFGLRPNVIKIKKGGQKISLRWNLSFIDQHLIKYCLVVSTSKIYTSLYEAENRLQKTQKLDFTSNYSQDRFEKLGGDRLEVHHLGNNTNYTLTDLVYDKTYYFTVFSINGSQVATQYVNTTFKFQRPKPISLKDAKPKTVNLRAQNGKASFRYKIGQRSLEGENDLNTLYWYVMPCGGVVNVEIRCRKTLLLTKRIFGYDKLVLNNTNRGERYVLKVETVSVDETQRVRSIEVMATVRPKMFPMPDMPNDLSIRQYSKPDDCNSVTIGWLPAKSYTDLRYCVYVQQYNYNNGVDFAVKPDQCESSYGNYHKKRDTVNNYRKTTRCYIGEKEKVSVQKILKLKSSTTYVIKVTVTKPRGRTLSYDLLKLDTNTCGPN
ncbi:Fibronectin type III,Immunoglobulin-like fold,Protein of unknown function DUF2369 [Cinara cedri]|uniref:Protein NDNF n=1 Tax=Cinara cedri TaxID=506608 RepID=A0A5E4MPY0_9HEMI|nr:Fibronectin type III,Immunoglobulin-like fold,Protein of unknown function DUF2369 [Cinara cedri]